MRDGIRQAKMRPMRRASSSLIPAGVLMAGLGAGLRATAQPPPAAAFEALKKAHTAEVDKTVLPLRGEFSRALQELERKLAAKGDYEGVRAVQKERRALEELMKSSTEASAAKTVAAPPEMANDGSVRLETAAAGTSGGVRPDESGGALAGWEAAGAVARWALPPGLPEGGYKVEISFRIAADSAGAAAVLQISESLHTLTRSLGPADEASGKVPEATAAVPSAPDAEGWRRVVLGTLRMHANAPFLELKTVTPEPAAHDLRIRSVRLLPTAAGS